VKWDVVLLYLSLESELALSCSNGTLKLEKSALFRFLVLSQIPFESCLAWFAYAKYALNVLFINLISLALRVAKYYILNFIFFFNIMRIIAI